MSLKASALVIIAAAVSGCLGNPISAVHAAPTSFELDFQSDGIARHVVFQDGFEVRDQFGRWVPSWQLQTSVADAPSTWQSWYVDGEFRLMAWHRECDSGSDADCSFFRTASFADAGGLAPHGLGLPFLDISTWKLPDNRSLSEVVQPGTAVEPYRVRADVGALLAGDYDVSPRMPVDISNDVDESDFRSGAPLAMLLVPGAPSGAALMARGDAPFPEFDDDPLEVGFTFGQAIRSLQSSSVDADEALADGCISRIMVGLRDATSRLAPGVGESSTSILEVDLVNESGTATRFVGAYRTSPLGNEFHWETGQPISWVGACPRGDRTAQMMESPANFMESVATLGIRAQRLDAFVFLAALERDEDSSRGSAEYWALLQPSHVDDDATFVGYRNYLVTRDATAGTFLSITAHPQDVIRPTR